MADPKPERQANPPPLDQHSRTREFKVHGLETKFCGRRQPLEVLYNAMRDAVNTRQLHVVPITAATGLGKTRLVHEFASLIDIEARGISLLTTDSMEDEGPFSLRLTDQVLRQRFAIGPQMDDRQCHEQIRKGLGGIVDERMLSDAAVLLAHLLSLPLPEGSRPHVSLPSDGFQQRALKTFYNLLTFDASRRPIILVCDGWQFAGERTRAVVAGMVSALRNAPVLLCVLGRRPVDAAIFSGAAVRPVELQPLDDRVMTTVLRHLLRRVQELPDSLVGRTVQRAKGNPALLEDIVRLMLQRGILLDLGQRWELRPDKLRGAKLPGTIGGAAKARVDGLEAKERTVLEMASIFGPVFWFGGVLSMMRLERDPKDAEELRYWASDKRESRLNATFLEMQGNDLIEFRADSGLPDQVAFGFVNPIEQQKLHAGLVEGRRRMLHRIGAQWLSTVAPPESFQLQEIIAFHYEQGGAPTDAAAAYHRAAQRARAAYQNRRAADLFRRALDLYDIGRAEKRCELLCELIDLLGVLGEYERSRERCMDMLYDSTVLASKVWGGRAYLRLGRTHRSQGDYGQAVEMLERGLTLFQDTSEKAGIADCFDDIGRVHWFRGEYGSYKQALSYFLKSLSLRRKLGDERAIAVSLGNIGHIHLGRGHVRQATESFEEALDLRRKLSDRVGLAQSLVGLGAVHFEAGRKPNALRAWEEGLSIATECGDRELAGMLQNDIGECKLAMEQVEEAERLFGSAHETALEIGDKRTLADVLRNKASLARIRGHFERALSLVGEALRVAESIGGKRLVGNILRTQGEILADTLRTSTEKHGSGFVVPNADKLASKSYQRSMAYFEEMGDNLGLAKSMRGYGAFLMERGVANKARKLFARADEILVG